MKYFSLKDKSHSSTFENAVLKGLAPNKALYFPEVIPKLPKSFFERLNTLSHTEIGFEVIKQYVGDEIPVSELKNIVEKTLNFDFPVVPVEENIKCLELFHGPTLAFKDVGAKFMAGSLGYFLKKGNVGKITVLVATSGDTGGAVANGFIGVEGVDVVILYPKGKVSDIQERQLTTLGKNIMALEVDGAFDLCQDLVKQAFQDEEIQKERQLTSANSINVARWLPQMFYYFLAYKQLPSEEKKLVFSVPSGNFGNICAGFLAREMGLPIDHFVAANNANRVVTDYLETEKYEPKPSVQTVSNAMDVGNPSNFVRVQELFNNEFNGLKSNLSSYSFDDETTKAAIKDVYGRTGYTLDPHGAVGYLGLKCFLNQHPEYNGVFLETAHPVKFLETVEEATGDQLDLPSSVKDLLNLEKKSLPIKDYKELKEFLLK
ncbi:threonine synthase [Antarcticibacterium sp. 1MA-6-2]|uniref:threonine synthase n=1 Tax=Antarcticibacterium sp. 1MA-6-2 TaxID=2908210 RepID=UPI001F1F7C14|nr:threonine synthase [Antarcticibacterium sp. 1MA-6-2]UJH91344.1 threonine synthase [Antarcticibacterium sp. 1MA-6-2]